MRLINQDSKLTLVLPWPPSVNHYWGERVAGKRIIRYIGPKGRTFRGRVQELVKPHLEHCHQYFAKPNRIAIKSIIRPPDRRRRDIDNLNKALFDALEHAGVFTDDEQIDRHYNDRDKEDVVSGGEISITIAALYEQDN